MVQNKDCWMKSQCNKVDCDNFCMRLYRLDQLYDNALIPISKRYPITLGLDKNRIDENTFNCLLDFMNKIELHVNNGDNLYLWSIITGNGKTSWAIKIAQQYLMNTWYKNNKECSVLFISVPRYLLSIKDNISEKSDYIKHIKDNVLDADLVIWDDIATKTTTSFEHENLLSIIDTRVVSSKSNIYTSNLSPQELHQYMGDRLYSRIYRDSTAYEFKGNDKRGINEKEL